ncbi:hypothetical protein [Bosea sp. (in: a-proteobacteria)]|uniref:hypothetical protein n=1 Tax=Bosea sp. (in: a-proteobacteria) TaxID=1871050 RepID=UPI002B48D486|nr:hypothetical protein [Bosea sp. (in: a-proteobacteria)]WRH56672.1 MAG: hypothetical protein RSE11_16720 [Bosea sp. (in: a-proteobacteria)]
MTAAPMLAFTYWMEAAREDLASARVYETAANRAALLSRTIVCVRYALGAANALRDQPRRALCLRVLTWLRAALAAL